MQPTFNDYVDLISHRFEAFPPASEVVKRVGRGIRSFSSSKA